MMTDCCCRRRPSAYFTVIKCKKNFARHSEPKSLLPACICQSVHARCCGPSFPAHNGGFCSRRVNATASLFLRERLLPALHNFARERVSGPGVKHTILARPREEHNSATRSHPTLNAAHADACTSALGAKLDVLIIPQSLVITRRSRK